MTVLCEYETADCWVFVMVVKLGWSLVLKCPYSLGTQWSAWISWEALVSSTGSTSSVGVRLGWLLGPLILASSFLACSSLLASSSLGKFLGGFQEGGGLKGESPGILLGVSSDGIREGPSDADASKSNAAPLVFGSARVPPSFFLSLVFVIIRMGNLSSFLPALTVLLEFIIDHSHG